MRGRLLGWVINFVGILVILFVAYMIAHAGGSQAICPPGSPHWC